MSLGERASKAANTVHQATEDAIVTASYHYVSSWPIMRAYASTDQSKVQNIDSAAFIGWQGTDDDGGGQGSITFVVRKDEYWQVYINGNYSNFVCWYTPLSGGVSQVAAHDHPELSDNDHEHDPHQNVDCDAVGEDCRTAISELDESTSLNANDEFIISTKDSSDIYSSKKVKLSLIEDSISPTIPPTSPGPGGGGGLGNWKSVDRIIDDSTIYTNNTGSSIIGLAEIRWNQLDAIKLFVTITPSGGPEITIPVTQETNSGGGSITTGNYFIPDGATYKFSAISMSAGVDYPRTEDNAFFLVHNFYETTLGGGGGCGGGATFSTGWSTNIPSSFSEETYTHNLGTDDIIYKVYVRDSSGKEHDITGGEAWAGMSNANCNCVNITSTQITIKFLQEYLDWTPVAQGVNAVRRDWSTATHIKVLAFASGGGGGSGAVEVYRSEETDMPITNTTAIFTHNLSQAPDYVTHSLVCQTAEHGYVAGDEIHFAGSYSSSQGWITFTADDSEIKMSVYYTNGANGPWYVDRRGTPNAANYITRANWKVIVRGYSYSSSSSCGGGVSAGTILGEFYLYTNSEGTSAKDFPWTIDLKNKTKQGYSTWSGAKFKLTDMILGEHYELRDQITPTEWTNNTTDFSGCKVLAAYTASLNDRNWLSNGTFAKLDSNYQPVGIWGQTSNNLWIARHITANSENKIEFDFGGNITDAKIVYGIIVK